MIDYLGTKGHFKNPNCLKNGITQNVVEVVATDDTAKVCAFKEISSFCILNKVFPIVLQSEIACSRQLFFGFFLIREEHTSGFENTYLLLYGTWFVVHRRL